MKKNIAAACMAMAASAIRHLVGEIGLQLADNSLCFLAMVAPMLAICDCRDVSTTFIKPGIRCFDTVHGIGGRLQNPPPAAEPR